MKVMTTSLSPLGLMRTRSRRALGRRTLSGVPSRKEKSGRLEVSAYSVFPLAFEANDFILDFIMSASLGRAREVITPYQDPAVGSPDPSFVLQLPDDVYMNSNLYAFQKTFDGPFQFDVFYDSGSSKQKLDCEQT